MALRQYCTWPSSTRTEVWTRPSAFEPCLRSTVLCLWHGAHVPFARALRKVLPYLSWTQKPVVSTCRLLSTFNGVFYSFIWKEFCESPEKFSISPLSYTMHGGSSPFFFFFFFCCIGVWTQGLYLETLHQPFFLNWFSKIGSHELFAQTGF
jgi:hypothetical protein